MIISNIINMLIRKILAWAPLGVFLLMGAPAVADSLASGAQLNQGDSIFSDNGQYRLTLQTDSNLVLYQGSQPLWSSGTVGAAAQRAVMQGDGNFVVYDQNNQPLWSTGTSNKPGSFLEVQNDGNVVIYEPRTPVWSTGTVQSN